MFINSFTVTSTKFACRSLTSASCIAEVITSAKIIVEVITSAKIIVEVITSTIVSVEVVTSAKSETSARHMHVYRKKSRQQLWLQVKISVFDIFSRKYSLHIATVYLPNQCSNYTLDTNGTRLSTYIIGSSVTWVRFSGGGENRLATTTPQTYRCATSATGWLVSALPSTVGSTVTAIVCFNWSSTICY
ncbi:unnamed protein product [Rotaria magnacalcarata]|uniref:Uncharacterized protein n=1 Tax=Rotaria magnacalcarata TaxID=392030 RepID=A0A819XA68_9BILA|nr:unnamed protein product [Rotaria magnacalcarata]